MARAATRKLRVAACHSGSARCLPGHGWPGARTPTGPRSAFGRLHAEPSGKWRAPDACAVHGKRKPCAIRRRSGRTLVGRVAFREWCCLTFWTVRRLATPMNMPWIRGTRARALAALIVFAGIAGCRSKTEGGAEDAAPVSLSAAADAFQTSLQSELQAAMKRGGPVEAVAVCADRAPAIRKETEKKFGVHLGRAALRRRNPEPPEPAWVTTAARASRGRTAHR